VLQTRQDYCNSCMKWTISDSYDHCCKGMLHCNSNCTVKSHCKAPWVLPSKQKGWRGCLCLWLWSYDHMALQKFSCCLFVCYWSRCIVRHILMSLSWCMCLQVCVTACLGGLLLNPQWGTFTIANIYPCQWRSMAMPVWISRECIVLVCSFVRLLLVIVLIMTDKLCRT